MSLEEPLAATELIHAGTHDLDRLSTDALVAMIVTENRAAQRAVEDACDMLARAVDIIVVSLRAGGRLHYIGAGSSGRLGVLDAAEMTPTFGTPPDFVRAHIAGGTAALTQAVEGAEDDAQAGARDVLGAVRAGDVMIGISASGGAPYVLAAMETARASQARTIAICNDANARLARVVDHAIVLETGPEVIAGSTRLKAGTAQKIALNAISTATMVRLGKVYENLMVDVVATNEKLRRRALRLVKRIAGVEDERARVLLEAASGNAKVAVVMEKRGVDAQTAHALLTDEGGFLRAFVG